MHILLLRSQHYKTCMTQRSFFQFDRWAGKAPASCSIHLFCIKISAGRLTVSLPVVGFKLPADRSVFPISHLQHVLAVSPHCNTRNGCSVFSSSRCRTKNSAHVASPRSGSVKMYRSIGDRQLHQQRPRAGLSRFLAMRRLVFTRLVRSLVCR